MNLQSRKFKYKIKTLLGRVPQSAVILMYHRVIDVQSTPFHGIVSVKHFSEHMEYLRKAANCIPLAGLRDKIKNNRLPEKSVIITFDDGYRDNYEIAYPILQKHEIPATIFIASDYVGCPHEYWWDELERLLVLPEELPQHVPLALGDRAVDLNFARFDKHQRKLLLAGVRDLLKTCRPADRESLLSALRELSGLGREGRPEYLPMQQEEVAALAQSGLIEIGAHTMTHPMLSALSEAEQRAEITGSIHKVEGMIGKPVLSFAYPFGSKKEYDQNSVDIVRSTGLQAAVTTVAGVVRASSNFAALPRLWVGDWDIQQFKATLEPYLYGAY